MEHMNQFKSNLTADELVLSGIDQFDPINSEHAMWQL